MPALAVADALRAEGASVSFAGTPDRAEAELVPAAGYEIDLLRLRGIDRRNPVRAAGAVALAARALPAARSLLRRRRADAVLGGGGYVAGPVGLAAARLGIPLVLTEADSHLGLANRLLAGRARRVCLAFPIAGREGPRYLVTGRPVPRAIIEADRGAARRRFGVEPEARCLLVFGGSLGARRLNEAAIEAFGSGERDFWVLHIAGRRDHSEIARRNAELQPDRYALVEYEHDLGDALASCDLVLSRAGGSVFELAAAGKPAVLVPFPFAAADHQTRNAAWMAEAGAALVVPDAELDAERCREVVQGLFADPGRLEAMAAAARAAARPDAAAVIARELLTAANDP